MKVRFKAEVLGICLATFGCSPSDDGEPGEAAGERGDGEVEGGKADDPTERAFPSIAPVHGVPNLDDDDGDGSDWASGPGPGDDDLSPLVLPDLLFDQLPPGGSVSLALSGDTGAVRLWRGTQLLLGDGAASTSVRLDDPADAADLAIELGDYRVFATLRVAQLDAGGQVEASGEVALRSSPLIIGHHLMPAEHVWAISVGSENQAFRSSLSAALGSRFTSVSGASYGFDVWVQDEIEFGGMTGGNGERVDIVIDSIRNRGLDDIAEDMEQPGTFSDTWGDPFTRTSFDSFGNLEASPPVVVDGEEFPFGRIYYGRSGTRGLNIDLANFLESQVVQRPIELDTTWLCVGHVDEFISFVPDSSAPKGFKLLFADTTAAIDILNGMSGGTSLPHYAFDHGYGTVGELRGDSNLIAENQDLQVDRLDPLREQLMDELGLTEADVIRVPSLFERVSGCSTGGTFVALIPGMVNSILVNPAGQQAHLFVPDPFMRSNASNLSSDPFVTAFANAMPDDLAVHFVDVWDTYHVNLGEAHCGSNVLRTPPLGWWDADQGGN